MKIWVLVGFLAMKTSVLFAQSAHPFDIGGVLVDHRGGSPIPSAFVSILPVNNGEPQDSSPSVLTDASGRFLFTNLPKGKYTLLAQRRGSRQYLFHGHGQFSTAIVTGPNLDTEHIVFALPAASRISGNVIDEDSEPIPDATIYLLKKVVVDGRSTIQQVEQRGSGSSGRFHFGPLRPGIFYIAVVAKPWYASHDDANRNVDSTTPQSISRDVAYPVTFSGDTTDPSAASPIAVDEGAEGKLTITLHAVPALHVPTGPAGANDDAGTQMVQSLSVLGPGAVPISVPIEIQQSVVSATQGVVIAGNIQATPELAGLAPGTYKVASQTFQADGSARSSDEEIALTENAPLARATQTLVQLSGQLIRDGNGPAGPNAMVGITFIDRRTRAMHPAFSVLDGQFSINGGLPPGTYEIFLTNLPGFSIQSISEGDGPKTPGNVLRLSGSRTAVTLVLHAGTAGVTSLEGVVKSDGKPCMAATVLLLPSDLKGAKPIGRDQSDSDGSFTIPDVTPGQYRLLAIKEPANDAAEDLAYRDARVIASYLPKSLTVTVGGRANSKPLQVEAQERVQTVGP